MATQYEALSLNNIDQGLFVQEAERQFIKMQDELVRHIREFSADECTAKLSLGVELKHKQGAVFITTAIDKKLPGVPKTITNALVDLHQDPTETLTLFTAVGGSGGDAPDQRQLCRRDGAAL